MYDRVISLKVPAPAGNAWGPLESPPEHVFGGPSLRRKMDAYRADSPVAELDEYLETVSEL